MSVSSASRDAETGRRALPSRGVRRKLLLVNVSLANGGLERQLLLLAANLPPDWEARLWTLEGGPFEGPFREAGIPWRCRPRRSRRDPTPALDLWRTMGSYRPDVVHAWHWMPSAAAAPACHLLGIPLIDGSIRMGSVSRSFGRPRRSIMRWAALVVANSQAGLNAWHVGPEKGRVVYNAFDTARLHGTSPRPQQGDAREGDGRLTAIMAARMDSQKDYRAVIEGARLLERDTPGSWHFLLVGNGADRAPLVEAAQDLIDAGIVTFKDAGLEAIEDIKAADVGILMTDPAVRAEGCSNSIMEYMACGLPVVCSDTGGSAELVREGQEGYVIAPYSAADLARRLSDLKAHPELRASMGAAGRTRIVEDFTVDRMVAEYLGIYEEAIAHCHHIR
jgi:glycosyltransferase involved in cell wall biosynthesis